MNPDKIKSETVASESTWTGDLTDTIILELACNRSRMLMLNLKLRNRALPRTCRHDPITAFMTQGSVVPRPETVDELKFPQSNTTIARRLSDRTSHQQRKKQYNKVQ